MEERLRQEYLRRLGIQSYFARHPLPGAATSVFIPLVEAAKTAMPTGTVTAVPEQQLPGKASFADRRTEAKVDTADSTAGHPVVPARTQQQTLDEVRFQLAFIRVSDELLALVLLPHVQDTSTLNPAQKALFSNLCRALNLPLQALDYSIKAFRWPFSEASFMDKSEAAARAALNTYLSQLLEDVGFSHLLLLGTNIAHLLTEFQQQLDGSFVVCRSLDEMLKMPSLKAETWKALKKLATKA